MNGLDWVILGYELRGGSVRVFASDTLTDADLDVESRIVNEQAWVAGARPQTDDTVTLSVVMKSYRMVEADTYEHAMTGLFKTWTPKSDRHQQLSAPTQGLQA